jgi:hypothetical protein
VNGTGPGGGGAVGVGKEVPPAGGGSFLNFSNSLTVTGESGRLVAAHVLMLFVAGNILTVADDLLKNDGQKFLEMMEQLAEHRTNREEEAAESVAADEDEEDDDDDDDDDEGDEEYEDDLDKVR